MNELYEALRLNEDSELSQGIFWIVDLDNISNNRDYCIKFYCDNNGEPIGNYDLNAKSGKTYNHEKVWKQLSSKLIHDKSFDYYPRGRVQISRGKAIIYLNPNIATEEVKDFLEKEFNLNKHNGINKIVVKADGSNHYRCYLDNTGDIR